MYCVDCGSITEAEPCTHCGLPPLLDGRYRLEAVLGRGVTGTTWRAVRIADGTPVAIKESALGTREEGRVRELALREAEVLRQLHHPQIPAYVEHLFAGRGKARALWLVEQYVEGTTLAAELENRRYSVDEVLAVVDELCEVLRYLHGRSPPIVHRDLKPSNVIRSADGTLVLVDFGSVRDGAVDPQLGGQTVAGTFGYMAPEQFAGDADPRSDLYALGALAIALLTRRDPASLVGADRRLRWRDKCAVPQDVGRLLDGLVALAPSGRPPSADGVRTRIRRLAPAAKLPPRVLRLANPVPTDEPEPFVELPAPVPRPRARARTLTLGLGLAAGAASGAAVLALLVTVVALGASLAPSPPARPLPPPTAAERVADAGVVPGRWPELTPVELRNTEDVECLVLRGSDDTTVEGCAAPYSEVAWSWAAEQVRPGVGTMRYHLQWLRTERPAEDLLQPARSEVSKPGAHLLPQTVLAGYAPVATPAAELPWEVIGQRLQPSICEARVFVDARGEPFHLSVAACPAVYHDAAVEALWGYRWRGTGVSFETSVEVPFTSP